MYFRVKRLSHIISITLSEGRKVMIGIFDKSFSFRRKNVLVYFALQKNILRRGRKQMNVFFCEWMSKHNEKAKMFTEETVL